MRTLQQARFWDPLYGRTELSECDYALIRSPEVQRLRYIRMCNINSMLITGASEISRFEHSLGVLRLTQEWIATHKKSVSETDAIALCAAALLHDMQTGPFGHSFQYILEDNKVQGEFAHDDLDHGNEATYYQDLDVRASFSGMPFRAQSLLGGNWDSVTAMIRGEGRYGPLISGSIDLDNIDNVIRLAYHVGIAVPDDAEVAVGIAKALEPTDGGLAVPLRAIPLIRRWQDIRRRLYEFLLLDWAEFSAKAMLTLAMEEAVQYNLVGADSWIMTDDELLFELEKNGIGEAQTVSQLVKRLRSGNLYNPIGLFRSTSTSMYGVLNRIDSKRKIESELCTHARNEYNFKSRILIHYILDKKKTERAIDVIISDSDQRKVIGKNSDSLLIGVFSSNTPPNEKVIEKLRNATVDALSNAGLRELTLIHDPLGEPDGRFEFEQLSFL